MAGEVTASSVILQTRLTASSPLPDKDVPGVEGEVRFEIDTDPAFPDPIRTEWMKAVEERDHVVKKKIEDLKPDVLYYYRIEFGPGRSDAKKGPARRFRTLPGPATSRPYRLAVVT